MEARENLLSMLSRFDDLPDNLLNETSDALQRAGIADDDERRHLARRIICDARATAARLYRDDHAQMTVATASGLAALLPQPNVVPAKLPSSAAPATSGAQSLSTLAEGVAEGHRKGLPALTADQALFAEMTPPQAVEKYMRLKLTTGGLAEAAVNVILGHEADAAPTLAT